MLVESVHSQGRYTRDILPSLVTDWKGRRVSDETKADSLTLDDRWLPCMLYVFPGPTRQDAL